MYRLGHKDIPRNYLKYPDYAMTSGHLNLSLFSKTPDPVLKQGYTWKILEPNLIVGFFQDTFV